MSQQNVDVVRANFAVIAGLDLVSWISQQEPAEFRHLVEALYAPDVEITWLEGNPDQRSYRGYDEVHRAFSDWLDVWKEFRVEPTEFIEAGDHVVVRNVQRGIGDGSRVEVSMESTMVFTLRDGLITRIHEFADHRRALDAAGLSQ